MHHVDPRLAIVETYYGNFFSGSAADLESCKARHLYKLEHNLRVLGLRDIHDFISCQRDSWYRFLRIADMANPIQAWRASLSPTGSNSSFSLRHCWDHRWASQEINLDNDGKVNTAAIAMEEERDRSIAAAQADIIKVITTFISYNFAETDVLKACDMCRRHSIKCETQPGSSDILCKYCAGHSVQCTRFLTALNQDIKALLRNRTQQDYQLQLMLLEQQNKIRLLMAHDLADRGD